MILHATTLALRVDREWRAVLLQGPSGVGKSDLALRALDAGWRLVADDRTEVWRSGDGLYVTAPPTIPGLIEVRGVGVLAATGCAFARAVLVVDCGPEGERVPEPGRLEVQGVFLPRLALDPLHASAVSKLGRVLSTRALGEPDGLAYLDASRARTRAHVQPSRAEVVDKRLG